MSNFRLPPSPGLRAFPVVVLTAAVTLLPALPPAAATTDSAQTAVSPWPTYAGNFQRSGSGPYSTTPNQPLTGDIAWRFDTDGSLQGAPAIGADGTVYVLSTSGYLYALNPSLQPLRDADRLLWRFPVGEFPTSSPAIAADGTIYVGSDDGHLYALDPRPGVADEERVLWSFAIEDGSLHNPSIAPDGTIYVGADDGHLYALNPAADAEERVLWRHPTGVAAGAPAIGADGTIYVGTFDSQVYALNADPNADAEERVLWSHLLYDVVITSPTLGADGILYVTSHDAHVYALDTDPAASAEDRELWRFATEYPLFAPLAADAESGLLYLGTMDALLYGLDPQLSLTEEEEANQHRVFWQYLLSGALRAEDTLEDPEAAFDSMILSPPAIGNDGTLYFASFDYGLYALHPDSPDAFESLGLLWMVVTDGHLTAAPVFGTDGTLYVASDDGSLYAIR